ncbi:MAG TPA: phosphate--acyl-ACP acyltransferase, partial [Candidatus Omnitrophota bacterium]|nr:phosphate--acyl-ACP acyltransferase [Candidatus Omnitrophota bacterium]
MKIVVDAMGGDFAPKAVIKGVVDAVKEFDVTVVLVGIKEDIIVELSQYQYPKEKIEIVHASEVVDMHDHATVSIRKKRDSSIAVGIRLLKEPQYDAFISAGNTGA